MDECKNIYHLSELLQKFGHRNIKESQENFKVEDPWGCGQIDFSYGSQTVTFSDYPDAKHKPLTYNSQPDAPVSDRDSETSDTMNLCVMGFEVGGWHPGQQSSVSRGSSDISCSRVQGLEGVVE